MSKIIHIVRGGIIPEASDKAETDLVGKENN
jgi:hypothetical protein